MDFGLQNSTNGIIKTSIHYLIMTEAVIDASLEKLAMKKGKKLFSGSPPGGLIHKLHLYNAKVVTTLARRYINLNVLDLLPLVRVCH